MVMIPATFLGVLAGTASITFKGRELGEDAEYLNRLAEGKVTSRRTACLTGSERTGRGTHVVSVRFWRWC
jgi:anaerobic C4-dicarboxylate transporter